MRAQGSLILIGYGPGIGHGVTGAFAAAGVPVAALSRRGTVVPPPAGRVEGFAVDAGDHAGLARSIAAAEAQLGPAGTLIFNAVGVRFGAPSTITAGDLAADLGVGVAGALAAARAVLPGMQARGHGRLLFTGGGWAHRPWAGAASISIAKAGLRALVLTLAEELGAGPVQAGLLTVLGQVEPGGPFDPDLIGARYLALATQPEPLPAETMFGG